MSFNFIHISRIAVNIILESHGTNTLYFERDDTANLIFMDDQKVYL